jgi:hypothetical protein
MSADAAALRRHGQWLYVHVNRSADAAALLIFVKALVRASQRRSIEAVDIAICVPV